MFVNILGQPINPIFKGQAVQEECLAHLKWEECWEHLGAQHSSWTAWPLKMGLIGFTEMWVIKYQSMLRKTPEQHRSQEPEITRASLFLYMFVIYVKE